MFASRVRKVFLPFFIFAISMRVLTGAAEAQINFTSLLFDHTSYTHLQELKAQDKSVVSFSNPTRANSNPDKYKVYSLYKKYVSPKDYSFVAVNTFSVRHTAIEHSTPWISFTLEHKPLTTVSHSPPAPTKQPRIYPTPTTRLEFGLIGISQDTSHRQLGGI